MRRPASWSSRCSPTRARCCPVWGLPHAGAYDAWERSKWTDGRGTAGVLSTSVLYHRYRSTGFNYNRGRANAISRSLLCHDFSESDIHIDTRVNLSDPAVVADAVVHNPSCAGCHQAMDPLARRSLSSSSR